MFDDVKNYIDKELINKKGIPYLDLMVYKEHEMIYHYYNGVNKVNGNEILCMFSMTKPLISVLVLRLIEENKLSLDDEVSKYLPCYKDAYVLDENGNKKNVIITIKHLLTMSAGFNYNLSSKSIQKIKERTNNKATTLEVINALIEEPLDFIPGEKFQYSLCFDVLGAVIEIVSGKRLSNYMDEIIFKPLNMNNSTLKRIKENIPYNYICDNAGNITKSEYNPYFDFVMTENYESAGAGLISTVEDYIKFADAIASGGCTKDGYKLLNEESINLIKEVHISSGNVKNNFTCVQGDDYSYGLGVRTRIKELPCGLPISEFGWDGAAGSYVMIDTKNKISIVIGMNLLGWPIIFTGEHLNIVKKIYDKIL